MNKIYKNIIKTIINFKAKCNQCMISNQITNKYTIVVEKRMIESNDYSQVNCK